MQYNIDANETLFFILCRDWKWYKAKYKPIVVYIYSNIL